MDEIYVKDLYEGRQCRLHCNACHKSTNHTIKSSLRRRKPGDDVDIVTISDYYIVQCNGCEYTHFCSLLTFGEAISTKIDQEVEVIDSQVTELSLFPAVGRYSFEPPLYYRSMPITVRTIYRETFETTKVDSPHLTAVGIRAVIEQVCLASGVDKKIGRLPDKIEELERRKVINKPMMHLLLKVKIVGDSGAHSNQIISAFDLENAWSSINNLLRYVYGTLDNNYYYDPRE